MRQKDKLVYGNGINDSDYKTIRWTKVGEKRVVEWRCPFYDRWYSMIRRCYAGVQKAYEGCSVSTEWLTFSNFKSWMETQEWEGNHLDKDLLVPESKLYSKETCVFLSRQVNNFMIDCQDRRGDWPIGVTFSKRGRAFVSQISVNNEMLYLGSFATPEAAHAVWKAKKKEMAEEMAGKQTDLRVAIALLVRYA